MLLENPSTYVQLRRKHHPGDRFPRRDVAAAPAAACCSTSTTSSCRRTNHGTSPEELSRAVSAGRGAGKSISAAMTRSRRCRRAAADRRAWHAGRRPGLGALRRRASPAPAPLPTLIEWDNDVPAWPVLRAEARRGPGYPVPRHARVGGMRGDHARTFEASLPAPCSIRNGALRQECRRIPRRPGAALCGLPQQRGGRPRQGAARRFPAVERLVGEEFFAGMAREFVMAHPPRSPLLLTYGDEFPDFIAAFEPARGAALSRRRGAARGGAHPRLSCGRRHAAACRSPSRPSIPMRCRSSASSCIRRSKSSARAIRS